MKKSQALPLILTIGVLFGFAIGLNMTPTSGPQVLQLNLSNEHKSFNKLREVIDFIDANYVEEIDHQHMEDDAIDGMIKNLVRILALCLRKCFNTPKRLCKVISKGLA